MATLIQQRIEDFSNSLITVLHNNMPKIKLDCCKSYGNKSIFPQEYHNINDYLLKSSTYNIYLNKSYLNVDIRRLMRGKLFPDYFSLQFITTNYIIYFSHRFHSDWKHLLEVIPKPLNVKDPFFYTNKIHSGGKDNEYNTLFLKDILVNDRFFYKNKGTSTEICPFYKEERQIIRDIKDNEEIRLANGFDKFNELWEKGVRIKNNKILSRFDILDIED
jgi:hypothetical protein